MKSVKKAMDTTIIFRKKIAEYIESAILRVLDEYLNETIKR